MAEHSNSNPHLKTLEKGCRFALISAQTTARADVRNRPYEIRNKGAKRPYQGFGGLAETCTRVLQGSNVLSTYLVFD